jgi:hypothetical protein
MAKRAYTRDGVEPWAEEQSTEWFRRVREIQLLSAPSPLRSTGAGMFQGDVVLSPRLGSTRSRVEGRELAAIIAGVGCGALVSLLLILLIRFAL